MVHIIYTLFINVYTIYKGWSSYKKDSLALVLYF